MSSIGTGGKTARRTVRNGRNIEALSIEQARSVLTQAFDGASTASQRFMVKMAIALAEDDAATPALQVSGRHLRLVGAGIAL